MAIHCYYISHNKGKHHETVLNNSEGISKPFEIINLKEENELKKEEIKAALTQQKAISETEIPTVSAKEKEQQITSTPNKKHQQSASTKKIKKQIPFIKHSALKTKKTTLLHPQTMML